MHAHKECICTQLIVTTVCAIPTVDMLRATTSPRGILCITRVACLPNLWVAWVTERGFQYNTSIQRQQALLTQYGERNTSSMHLHPRYRALALNFNKLGHPNSHTCHNLHDLYSEHGSATVDSLVHDSSCNLISAKWRAIDPCVSARTAHQNCARKGGCMRRSWRAAMA